MGKVIRGIVNGIPISVKGLEVVCPPGTSAANTNPSACWRIIYSNGKSILASGEVTIWIQETEEDPPEEIP